MSGPGCIKPSQDKRVLNFCSGTITYCLEIVVTSSLNRVLKCDVIKMKFLKLWDLSGYSERTMPKRPICQK